MDERFEALCGQALEPHGGIGTLGEKTLHFVLKNYYEPDTSKQEVKIGRYVADILNDRGVIEIQTRNFNALRGKLAAFLQDYPVTVVCPVVRTKWLAWVDEQTGEVSKKRRSPKTGIPCDLCRELYKIKGFLKNPGLRFCIPVVNAEEYRLLNGWSADKKHGSTRYERLPVSLEEEIQLRECGEYRRLLPAGLPPVFTSADFAQAVRRNVRFAATALQVLYFVGAVERIGKQGNRILYRVPPGSI